MGKTLSLLGLGLAALPLAILSLAILPLPAGAEDARPPDTKMDRQSLRAQQRVLTPDEQRHGETRLDQIDRKSRTDPRAARDMKRIYEADQSLSTINRPIPNSNGGK